jgi:DNA-binding XRE family transcriptional regulator
MQLLGYLRIDQINWATQQADFAHTQTDPAHPDIVAFAHYERHAGGSCVVDGVTISDPDLRQLGARLRALRRDAGRTQQQAAVAIGLTRTYLTDVEAGRKNITLRTLYALAEHFGTDPAELLLLEAGSPDG